MDPKGAQHLWSGRRRLAGIRQCAVSILFPRLGSAGSGGVSLLRNFDSKTEFEAHPPQSRMGYLNVLHEQDRNTDSTLTAAYSSRKCMRNQHGSDIQFSNILLTLRASRRCTG